MELESVVAGSFKAGGQANRDDDAKGHNAATAESDDEGEDPFAHMRGGFHGHGHGGAGPQVQCAQQ